MQFSLTTSIDRAFATAWGAWFVSWMLAAIWRSRAVKRPSIGEQAPYRVLTILGAFLLFRRGDPELWKPATSVSYALLGLTIAGFVFTWWARIHLGALWSGTVTRKADHRVVDTGPYRIVRHPIYTGLILSAFCTAFYRGNLLAIAGAAVLSLSFYVKARLEERFLREELGDDYNRYAQRVRMLIPFVMLLVACTHARKAAHGAAGMHERRPVDYHFASGYVEFADACTRASSCRRTAGRQLHPEA